MIGMDNWRRIETGRVDGVKAPQHRRTGRSARRS